MSVAGDAAGKLWANGEPLFLAKCWAAPRRGTWRLAATHCFSNRLSAAIAAALGTAAYSRSNLLCLAVVTQAFGGSRARSTDIRGTRRVAALTWWQNGGCGGRGAGKALAQGRLSIT